MKKLLILASVFLVTSVSYSQSAREEKLLAEACRGLTQEDCREKANELAATGSIREDDDGWKLKEVLKLMTKRYPASVYSKINKCNVDAATILVQISRLQRGSDGWIDKVDKMYLKYSSCVRKAHPKTTAPGGAGESGNPDKATAF